MIYDLVVFRRPSNNGEDHIYSRALPWTAIPRQSFSFGRAFPFGTGDNTGFRYYKGAIA